MASEKKVALKTSDGKLFEVEEAIAMQSQAIKHIIEDDCASATIPLTNVDSKTLAKVIDYCKKHADEKIASEDLKKFDSQFVDEDQAVLYDLVMAANFLEIKNLLNILCEKVANMIKGKSPKEIRKTFNIENDFTPEEDKEIRKQNAWAFE